MALLRREITKKEAQEHVKCDGCGHATYWVNRDGAKCGCRGDRPFKFISNSTV